jgi:CheY-like chemotaxis protein
VGIAEDQLTSICLEFHQADRRRDEDLGGIGLGLALTRRLVELHDGDIGVESTVGKGSTFWFTLPAGEATAAAGHAAPERDAITPANLDHVILIAEDNEANLAMLCDMLSLRGYELLVARNGQECFDLAMQHQPDLIITDMRMPVMDGLEAVRLMREQPQLATTPIIALTANASDVSRDACIGAGCNEHLTKPVKTRELFPVVERLLTPDEQLEAV